MFEPTIAFGALLFNSERFILIGALYFNWSAFIFPAERLSVPA